MNKKIVSLAVSLAIFTTGCSLAPDYERPAPPVTAEWNEQNAVSAPLNWQEQFTDPDLQQLINIALQNNRDLKLASLAVAEYQAQYRVSRANLFPTLGGNASLSRGTNTSVSPLNPDKITNTYQVGANLSWEIDFFGKIRNQKNAVLEQYFSIYENQRSAQISLIAAIANAYYTLIADKELLALFQETLETEQDSYKLTKNKYDIGASSELELSQSQTAVATAEINVANYERVLKLDQNQLLLLVGTNLPEINSLKKITDITVNPINVLRKEDLISQRPDILAAEHKLKAANYNIGVARAALFPSISLSGTLATITNHADKLFESSSKYWNISPALTIPIFNLALYSNLDVVDIQKQEAIVSYEKTIQEAFKEVSDAVKSFDSLNKQYESQVNLYRAAKKYFEMADLRYNEGVDSYLTRLDAQRLYVSARQGLVSTKLSQLRTQIDLYKAIGGGLNQGQEANQNQ